MPKEKSTKMKFGVVELKALLTALCDARDQKYAGCKAEDIALYREYKEDMMLINRINRAIKRIVPEHKVEKVLSRSAWSAEYYDHD